MMWAGSLSHSTKDVTVQPYGGLREEWIPKKESWANNTLKTLVDFLDTGISGRELVWDQWEDYKRFCPITYY